MAIIWGTGIMSKQDAQEKGYGSFKRFWHNVGYAVSFKWLKNKK